MRLPDLSFNLPEWKDSDFNLIRAAEKKVKTIASDAVKGSDAFQQAFRRILEIVLSGNTDRLPESINTSVDVRAITYLLGSWNDFAKHLTLNKPMLEAMAIPRNPMSKLSLLQLIRAYFVRYDTVASPEVLADWRELICLQFSKLELKGASSDLASYAHFAEILFSAAGPAAVVAFAKNKQSDLDGVLRELGLSGFSNGRFLTLCRYQYYLETLKTMPVGAEHEILHEVVKTDVVNAPFDDSRLLGHAVLEILIDRSAGSAISSAWQSVILTIAGDPRVPTSNPNYQKWWVLLGEQRIGLMRGWLSRFDLALFLKVLEQSARDTSHSDMERMFESRKRFMEGLLEQGVVSQSRLFLSTSAERYLKRYYKQDQLPEYARVDSKDTSMIYLNLAGKVHMVEGSHSFKLKLFDQLPSKSKLIDYSATKFSDFSLRTGVVGQYYQEFESVGGLRDLTHDVHLNWQHSAITFLAEQGISVSIHELIGAARYREYKSKFGVY
ncbi:EH signature domain-containing protein [Rheinheimera sp. FR7-31]|uniref:EH signature domain-containing protein n=1 Tax=Rheinheimera fenheensis TaxID=3152295 RepID=UPI00325F534A